MHIISEKPLRDFWTVHPESKKELQAWIQIASKSIWTKFADVREVYADADQVGKFTVFNICFNNYRLIVVTHFNRGKIYVRHVLTHAEYDKETWKQEVKSNKARPGTGRSAKDKTSHGKKAPTRRKRR